MKQDAANPTVPAPYAESRADFIARIRTALGPRGTDVPEAPSIGGSLARLIEPRTDLVDLFRITASSAGMTVHPCSESRLEETLHRILAAIPARRVVVDMGESGLARPAVAAVAATGATRLDPRGGPNLQFDADAGITDAFAAIAETGSLVIVAESENSRSSFLIPPVHIAIVRTSQIIPDLVDLGPAVRAAHPALLPTSVVLVSGPSKTGDIEGIIVTGVHGPGQVHIILAEPAS